MKKISALAAAVLALAATTAQAQDFTLLTTPEDVYNNSIEDVAGAKAEFQTVLADVNSTDEQKTAAMQTYMQQASPKAGYGFDMSFLLKYTSINDTNKNGYTPKNLATAWQTDITELTFGEDSNNLATGSNTTDGVFMRVYSATVLKEESSFNKFAAYQSVNLAAGYYQLESQAYLQGVAKAANLAAGDNLSADIIGGGKMATYSVNFKMTSTEDIKLGFWRNSTAGGLTHICFNNVNLYKISDVIAITDDATSALTTATNVDVLLNRDFTAGEYTPICLPFIIENWRDVFDDLIAWSNYTAAEGENEATLTFMTIAGANTQARKPYLAKAKTDINEDNYLLFKGVDIAMGTAANPSKPGTWIKSVADGEDAFPVFMTGNWAAGTVPAGCYYLDGENWKLSDGTAPLKAFSAYIDATALTDRPETMKMSTGGGTATIIDHNVVADAEAITTVYILQGMAVRLNVPATEATAGLPAGIYIVAGRKVMVK